MEEREMFAGIVMAGGAAIFAFSKIRTFIYVIVFIIVRKQNDCSLTNEYQLKLKKK